MACKNALERRTHSENGGDDDGSTLWKPDIVEI